MFFEQESNHIFDVTFLINRWDKQVTDPWLNKEKKQLKNVNILEILIKNTKI